MRRLSKLSARLRARMAVRGVPELRGLKLQDCLKVGSESVVFTARFHDREVVLKHLIGADVARRASAHSDELYTQCPQMKDGEFRVPEPILTRPDQGLIVMERAPGLRLDKAIIAEPDRRNELLTRAGEWLARYTLGRKVEDSFGGGYWIKTRRKSHDAMSKGGDKARVGRLIDIMEDQRNRIGPLPITRARSHGDFVALNLILDGDTIWGVDIQNSHWLALVKDIARFLVYLEIRVPEPRDKERFAGLACADIEALTAARGLIRAGELEAMLPYFAAVELTGRLISDTHDTRVLTNARALADRMIGTRPLAKSA